MIKFLDNKLFRYLSDFLLLNSSILPVKSSSALAAWALNTNGVLELRTKSNTNLKAYFQRANQISGDRFWVDFPGELKNPRTIKGNGPIKEVRLGKPNKGKTRLVIEFKEETYLKPLTWRLVGLDPKRWRIKLFDPKYTFKKISEGQVINRIRNIKKSQKSIYSKMDLKKGTKLSIKHLILKSPGGGFKPYELSKLINRTLKKDIYKEEIIRNTHFKQL